MTQKLTKDARLDLEAPLLSVRRHSVPPVANPANKLQDPVAGGKPVTHWWRSSVPSYNSELKSGPVHSPGVVPFVWEQKPGQPKAGPASRQLPPLIPLLPPGRTRTSNVSDPNGTSRNPNAISQNSADSKRGNEITEKPAVGVSSEEFLEEEEEEDNFSDAIDALSRTESFFMNCSASGVSGIPDAVRPLGGFATDPQARALMMDRFLPAAQAMVTSSSQCAIRKQTKIANRVENGESGHRRERLPYQHRPNFVARYPSEEFDCFDGDDDDEYDDNWGGKGRHFTSKACGFLPLLCLKSSLSLLKPMAGMKVGVRRPLPPPTCHTITSDRHSNVPLSQAEDELWESVYKHKLSLGIPRQGDSVSKSTSKSNQLLQWSDSQTLDESSSCQGSRDALVEIAKGDVKNGRKDGSRSFDKDGERYWAISSSHGSQQGSGGFSPTMVEDIHVDSGVLAGLPHSKHSSTGSEMDYKSLNIVSEVRGDTQRIEQCHVVEGDNEHVVQPVVDDQHNVGSLSLKRGGQSKNNSSFSSSVLPLPLPKTPSESWLSRTLPSISARAPSGHSIFDSHVPHRKGAFYLSSTDPRKENDAKPLESKHPHIPRAVLRKLQQRQTTLAEAEEGSVEHSDLDKTPDVKPSKPPRRQIRFADVLMTPLSPRTGML